MLKKLKLYADFVVLRHTLFAIPFAYLGAILASKGIPELRVLFWVGLAFLGARSAAMALNNLIDKDIDAKNPRTANREMPAGKITLSEVWGLIVISYFFLFYSAYKLNPLCLALAPIIPVTSIIYPYLKRSLPISHFVLGMNLGYAPVGGWLAVTGIFNFPFGAPEIAMLLLLFAVTFWVAGFDIIYSLHDIDFDIKNKLYSVPAVFGVKRALDVSFVSHILMLILLVGLMLVLKLGIIFKVGLIVIAALIWYEHTLVKADNFTNVPVAFFNVNAAVSLSMLAFTALDIVLS
ncbi:MAG: 4-hydroxybenzoate octaprenyltransferase [Candidatus Methanoperedens nitroreducens]|uniref:4-hydroxybenzoate octaprenyltransferase n=1 Tax=Candidatus Methanoperedens nitratireducens TaxID=1392998 RepID=A0A0P7ZKV0_9EURY|nr:UbiA-like polyprenyltransferase [Candidatus Methanoperedens sp. BLZ2]KAB2947142.1 MAG: 4-hydroxybenzoate octaprenyltransferase [Candidatus Methanoperedens sp.]KPQ44696.1 MAG: 4-hydroxybenzoate octaprenyltransferase [Candidatus Methanoperedens sp. BLZ1]MCX9078010.1 putative 4-hydroxybenzoate polyprenyltransferase [Candidatus Methanoperedens sp.]